MCTTRASKLFGSESSIDDDKLFELTAELKDPLFIETISIRCSTVTDASVIPLFRLCKNVKKVLLAETNITDKSLLTLFENCPNVTKLYLSHCSITDASISKLPYRDLTHLSLNFCGGDGDGDDITDESIRHLAKICTKLSYLGIASCDQITSNCLGSLLKQNPDMTKLILFGCEGLSSKIAGIIIKNCPSLMSIDIAECPNLEENYYQIENYINQNLADNTFDDDYVDSDFEFSNSESSDFE